MESWLHHVALHNLSGIDNIILYKPDNRLDSIPAPDTRMIVYLLLHTGHWRL